MIDNNNVIAIIPARGGSTRIKKKNITLVGRKPLISYTIEFALKSKYIDKVIVYTDNEEIANIAKIAGADVPVMESSNYSGEYSIIPYKIIECINILEAKYGTQYIKTSDDIIVVLQPTSPLRDTNDIDISIENFSKSKNDILVSVNKVSKHPYRMCLVADNILIPLFANKIFSLSETFPDVVTINGAIYISTRTNFMDKDFYHLDWGYYELDEHHSIDIDYIEQLEEVRKILHD